MPESAPRGDNTPQPIWPLRGWPAHLAARDTCNDVGAKMSFDATKPLRASEMTFKRICRRRHSTTRLTRRCKVA